MVWAKLKGYPWWPGMVDYCPDSQVLFDLLLLILLGRLQTKQNKNRIELVGVSADLWHLLVLTSHLLGTSSNQNKQEQNRTSRSIPIPCGDCCWSSHHKGSKCADCSGLVSALDDFWPPLVLTSHRVGTSSNQTNRTE